MMYLKVNITNRIYHPGSRKLKGVDQEHVEEFIQYLAEEMKNEIVKAINTQKFKNSWKPLSVDYVKYKKKHNLSLNIWEATGLLKDSIRVYKRSNYYEIGIDKRKKYKKSGIKVYDVARWIEYGTTRMPARPLFRKVVTNMSKNIDMYWKRYVKMKGGTV